MTPSFCVVFCYQLQLIGLANGVVAIRIIASETHMLATCTS